MPETQNILNQRMLPSIERKVSEIKDEDIRVRVLGTVVDKRENTLVLDDGTGKITSTFDEAVNADPGQLVRVFGRVITTADGKELQGEVLQNMKGLDMKLYEKVNKLFKFKV